jgi:hypothetical protein
VRETPSSSPKLIWGAEAGLLAGFVVAGFYFVSDLVHLAPLSTPAALGRAFVGPGNVQLTGIFPDGVVAWVAFAGNLVAFTLLHFLVFAMLGVAAVLLFRAASWPLNLFTGALYGLVACSGVFYLSMAFASTTVLASGVPHLGSVLVANALAGAAIGGGVRLMMRDARTGERETEGG